MAASRRLPHASVALDRTTGFSREDVGVIIGLLARRAERGTSEDLAPAVLERFETREFDWPDFDRWQALFAIRSQFPPLWEDVRVTPSTSASAATRRAYGRAKLALLLDWLLALEVTRSELGGALERYARKGVRAEVVRQADALPCPICDPFNHQAVAAPPSLPPFHAGCRCLVLAGPPLGGIPRGAAHPGARTASY